MILDIFNLFARHQFTELVFKKSTEIQVKTTTER